MSKYWLDWYIEHMMGSENPCRIARGKEPYPSRADCLQGMVREAAQIGRCFDPFRHRHVNEDHLLLVNRLAPFAGVTSSNPPLAIAVTVAPGHEVFYQDRENEERAKEIVRSRSTVYLDLAGQVFLMPGGVFQVRALFVWRVKEDICFCAVLTRPGSEKGWLFAWKEGHRARNSRETSYDDVWALDIPHVADHNRPINHKKVDHSGFGDLERLAWMSLANWEMLEKSAAPVLPNWGRGTADRKPDAQMAEAVQDMFVRDSPASSSIFDVKVLPALDDQRIQYLRNRASGMSYQPRQRKNCAHMVDGFYRMQPFGPGRKLLKKVWIAGHKRGVGAPKPVMYSLPGKKCVAA
ncbi:hypothetical protein [Brucella pituitosa]